MEDPDTGQAIPSAEVKRYIDEWQRETDFVLRFDVDGLLQIDGIWDAPDKSSPCGSSPDNCANFGVVLQKFRCTKPWVRTCLTCKRKRGECALTKGVRAELFKTLKSYGKLSPNPHNIPDKLRFMPARALLSDVFTDVLQGGVFATERFQGDGYNAAPTISETRNYLILLYQTRSISYYDLLLTCLYVYTNASRMTAMSVRIFAQLRMPFWEKAQVATLDYIGDHAYLPQVTKFMLRTLTSFYLPVNPSMYTVGDLVLMGLDKPLYELGLFQRVPEQIGDKLLLQQAMTRKQNETRVPGPYWNPVDEALDMVQDPNAPLPNVPDPDRPMGRGGTVEEIILRIFMIHPDTLPPMYGMPLVMNASPDEVAFLQKVTPQPIYGMPLVNAPPAEVATGLAFLSSRDFAFEFAVAAVAITRVVKSRSKLTEAILGRDDVFNYYTQFARMLDRLNPGARQWTYNNFYEHDGTRDRILHHAKTAEAKWTARVAAISHVLSSHSYAPEEYQQWRLLPVMVSQLNWVASKIPTWMADALDVVVGGGYDFNLPRDPPPDDPPRPQRLLGWRPDPPEHPPEEESSSDEDSSSDEEGPPRIPLAPKETRTHSENARRAADVLAALEADALAAVEDEKPKKRKL